MRIHNDEQRAAPSAFDALFYVAFIIAIIVMMSRQGWYAPGL